MGPNDRAKLRRSEALADTLRAQLYEAERHIGAVTQDRDRLLVEQEVEQESIRMERRDHVRRSDRAAERITHLREALGDAHAALRQRKKQNRSQAKTITRLAQDRGRLLAEAESGKPSADPYPIKAGAPDPAAFTGARTDYELAMIEERDKLIDLVQHLTDEVERRQRATIEEIARGAQRVISIPEQDLDEDVWQAAAWAAIQTGHHALFPTIADAALKEFRERFRDDPPRGYTIGDTIRVHLP